MHGARAQPRPNLLRHATHAGAREHPEGCRDRRAHWLRNERPHSGRQDADRPCARRDAGTLCAGSCCGTHQTMLSSPARWLHCVSMQPSSHKATITHTMSHGHLTRAVAPLFVQRADAPGVVHAVAVRPGTAVRRGRRRRRRRHGEPRARHAQPRSRAHCVLALRPTCALFCLACSLTAALLTSRATHRRRAAPLASRC